MVTFVHNSDKTRERGYHGAFGGMAVNVMTPSQELSVFMQQVGSFWGGFFYGLCQRVLVEASNILLQHSLHRGRILIHSMLPGCLKIQGGRLFFLDFLFLFLFLIITFC